MILYITEKPSLGRALVDVLPKPHIKGDGFIKVGDNDIVTWCVGHLLKQAEPDKYNEIYKKWRIEHLPIIPDTWKLEVKEQTQKQFNVLKQLIEQADTLVNVADPDREGQLLVDEIINYCNVSKEKKLTTKRCLISDLNPEAIKRSLENLKNNMDFVPLATSALARSRADWLYGINMTRLCTIKGNFIGHKGVLSIGRVQTPILGLVVNRDLEIENFVSKPFYELNITLQTKDLQTFTAKWKPSEACEIHMDDENRIINKKLIEHVINKINNQEGKIIDVKKSLKKQAPPLLYNLSALQIDAARKFNLSAKQVLDICQSLYEKYKLITYPRSDCRYLPKEHYKNAKQILSVINKNLPELSELVTNADSSIKTKVWDDKKVTAHHAIVPTARIMNLANLGQNEQNIYNLIARQYLCQFYLNFEFYECQIDTQIETGLFISKQNDLKQPGWKVVLSSNKNTSNQAEDEDDLTNKKLPKLKVNDIVRCIETNLDEKQTTPPRYFTDATLLSAITNIARYVEDKEIKKILRDTDGLGTEATRAGIIELLFNRGYLVKKGKEIRSTELAKKFIQLLPKQVTSPDMTAHWEHQLEGISKKEVSYNFFIENIIYNLNHLITQIKSIQLKL